jgi:hypothetical protein
LVHMRSKMWLGARKLPHELLIVVIRRSTHGDLK